MLLSVATIGSRGICRALPHVSCEPALERLGSTGAPALGDGLRIRIGKDVLFSFLQSVEDASRRELGRGFRYVEASGHVGVDGTWEHGVNRYALAGQEHSQ